jgi:hypothetical protein
MKQQQSLNNQHQANGSDSPSKIEQQDNNMGNGDG